MATTRRSEQSGLLPSKQGQFRDSETGTEETTSVVATPPEPQWAAWEVALRYAPTLYMALIYAGLAIALAACNDVRAAFGDVGQLSIPSSCVNKRRRRSPRSPPRSPLSLSRRGSTRPVARAASL